VQAWIARIAGSQLAFSTPVEHLSSSTLDGLRSRDSRRFLDVYTGVRPVAFERPHELSLVPSRIPSAPDSAFGQMAFSSPSLRKLCENIAQQRLSCGLIPVRYQHDHQGGLVPISSLLKQVSDRRVP
jgi:hypothetical protein